MKNFIILLSLLTSINFVLAQQSTEVLTQKKLEAIQAYVDHFDSNDQLMGNVSIFEKGKEILNLTFGAVNIKTNTKGSNKYFIGSITKLFTGLVFAQLSEKGQIDLDEKLSAYFPELPNAQNITLDHMLRHTSGMGDYVVKEDSLLFWLENPQSTESIIDEIIRQDVSFQPGDSVSYSNSAYYILGKVLEKELGKTYLQIIEKQIAQPYGLTNTSAVGPTMVHPDVHSYRKEGKHWTIMKEFCFANACAAGDIASNARDLNLLLTQLFDNKIVSAPTLKAMTPIDGDYFGAGMMLAPFYDISSYGHGGDTYGTHSAAFYNPDNNICLLYTSPSPRDQRGSRMPSSA